MHLVARRRQSKTAYVQRVSNRVVSQRVCVRGQTGRPSERACGSHAVCAGADPTVRQSPLNTGGIKVSGSNWPSGPWRPGTLDPACTPVRTGQMGVAHALSPRSACSIPSAGIWRCSKEVANKAVELGCFLLFSGAKSFGREIIVEKESSVSYA